MWNLVSLKEKQQLVREIILVVYVFINDFCQTSRPSFGLMCFRNPFTEMWYDLMEDRVSTVRRFIYIVNCFKYSFVLHRTDRIVVDAIAVSIEVRL